jgi:hypothetical protein
MHRSQSRAVKQGGQKTKKKSLEKVGGDSKILRALRVWRCVNEICVCCFVCCFVCFCETKTLSLQTAQEIGMIRKIVFEFIFILFFFFFFCLHTYIVYL